MYNGLLFITPQLPMYPSQCCIQNDKKNKFSFIHPNILTKVNSKESIKDFFFCLQTKIVKLLSIKKYPPMCGKGLAVAWGEGARGAITPFPLR